MSGKPTILPIASTLWLWISKLAPRRLANHHRPVEQTSREVDRLANIVRRTSNIALVTDKNRRIIWANEAFTRVTGYTLDEVRGKSPGSILQFEKTNPETIRRIREALNEGRSFQGVILNRGKGGREYWLDLDIQPEHDEHGKLIGFLAIETDITERVEATERLSSLFEALSEGIIEMDSAGHIIRCNPAAERILGVSSDELISRSAAGETWHAFDENGVAIVLENMPAILTLRTGRAVKNFVHGIHKPDGETRWLSIGTQPIRDAEGKITGVVVSMSDITDERNHTRRLETIIEGASLGTWDWIVETGETHFNHIWADMLGYGPDEIEPHVDAWEKLVHPDDLPETKRLLSAHLEGRTPIYTCEHRLRRKDGTWCWVLDSGQVLERDGNGNPIRAAGIHLDITEAKEAHRKLIEAKGRASDANRAKSEFLANMSHEIRTPMTAILGYTTLLLDDETAHTDPKIRRDYLGTIQRNGEHLLTVINDILDLSKIEAGKMVVEATTTDPHRILNEVESLMRVKARAKGISLRIVHETALPATIQSDPVRLRQILVNLVGNAIKFTELGGVTVFAGLDTHNTAEPLLRFRISDTGIGMTAQQQTSIFEAFQQADASTTRKFGGTGLGLRISRNLARLLGGDISVTSEPENGSTFSFFIRTGSLEGVDMLSEDRSNQAKQSERPTDTHRIAPRALTGRRIYFCEDGPDNQRLISHHLRKAGAEVSIFENGLLCLQAMTDDGTAEGALKPELECDVVLTDIQMPEMDGHTLARRLRGKGWTGPIIALTAHAMEDDIERCFEAGCDQYASKPIDREKLIAICSAPSTASRQAA